MFLWGFMNWKYVHSSSVQKSYSCRKFKISQLSFLKSPPTFPRGSYCYQLVVPLSGNILCVNKHMHIKSLYAHSVALYVKFHLSKIKKL